MLPCPYAGAIERSLELTGERCGDPAPLVYRRLFAAHPKMQAHFWRDENGLIKGEMLSRTFEAILDFVGPRRYADMMISAELVTHEGYDIPREIFATFFGFVRDAVQESLGPDWSPDLRDAWASLLLDIDHFVLKTPRSDTSNPYFNALRETFENAYAPP
jgi:hemoglobin-like flavoprotein